MLKTKVCNTLSNKWEENTSKFNSNCIKIYILVDPPLIDSVTKYFTFKALKKIIMNDFGMKIEKNSYEELKKNKISLTREEKERLLGVFNMIDWNINERKEDSLFRSKSPLRMERIIEENKLIFKKKNKKFCLFRDEKLRVLKTKVMNLLKTDKELWGIKDKKLMSILMDPKVMSLIKKI